VIVLGTVSEKFESINITVILKYAFSFLCYRKGKLLIWKEYGVFRSIKLLDFGLRARYIYFDYSNIHYALGK